MAEEKKKQKTNSPLIGSQAQPTVLDKTVKLDIDTNKVLIDNIIDAGLKGGLDISTLENFTSMSNSRDQIYQLIDTMTTDSTVSSIIRTYAEEVCEPADNGHIVWCEADDPNISKYVNYLLNVMNVDKNIFGWVYCLIKYGDVYLKMYRESDYEDKLFKTDNIDNAASAKNILNESVEYPQNLNENVNISIHKTGDPYSGYLEMVRDPSSMFELTKYGKTYGYVEIPPSIDGTNMFLNYLGNQAQPISNYRMKSSDVTIFQADDFVHACLEEGLSRFPEQVQLFLTEDDYKTEANAATYAVKSGKSLLYDSYKIWREKSLLENAALLNRITRSSIVRNIQVEVGDMPKSQVQNTLSRVKALFEQKSAINTGSGMVEYNNPGPIENNIFTATNNGKGAITVNSVGGDVEVKNLADLDWWNNKFYSSYGVPKQYFGWCLGKDTKILLLDGTTHTIEDLYNNKAKYISKGIMGCNTDGSLCPTTISNIMLTNEHAQLIRIWLDNNEYVDVTPDHKMMLRDGTFIEAQYLKENDSLMPFYTGIYTDGQQKGRRWVLDNNTGKRRLQFHVVAEKKYGKLEAGYQIHHGPDEHPDKLNDDFDNLTKLTVPEHNEKHINMLHAMAAKRNAERKLGGQAVNANVGSRYITNGSYYTTLKAGEQLPDGFWFEGPSKSDETKAKMSAARLQVLKDHPKYKNLGGFKKGEASDEVISNMQAGQAKYHAEMSDEERQAKHELSVKNGKANIANMQAKRMAMLMKDKPEVIRKPRKLRCPVCGTIFEKQLNDIEYTDYLDMKKLHFCSPEHRALFDNGGKLARSYQLFIDSGLDPDSYENARFNSDSRPDTYLRYSSLEPKLDTLMAYVPEVNHQVAKIEYLDSDNKVYDITVADNCHTFALACGIFVHNCDDGAGFNGGTSLSILSSVFAKGVKRVQNATLQMITDAVNLICLNKGCRSYLNNFVLKMREPITQEEKDYRTALTDRINAISNMQALFADVETRSRKLIILKDLIKTLNYGDSIINELEQEIKAAEAMEEQAKADEEAAKAAEIAGIETAAEAPIEDEISEEPEEATDIDLGMSSIAEESFKKEEDKTVLTEDNMLFENDDLPTPEELNKNIDFTQNN